MAAIVCAATVPLSAVLARAEWLRLHAIDAGDAERAIQLDPLHPYGYTLRAEHLEYANRPDEAEQAWREALRRDSRDAEVWIRVALLEERRGALAGSEASLLQAARVSHTWLPRWSLVNFYLRHDRHAEARTWSRLAFGRASADVTALFTALSGAGIDAEPLLPPNRRVFTAWLGFLLSSGEAHDRVERAAARLSALIPRQGLFWPGADGGWKGSIERADDWETTVLFHAVDALLDQGDGPGAARVWNLLGECGIVSGKRWDANAPSVDARFGTAPAGAGMDWRPVNHPGVEVRTARSELLVAMDGQQPEAADLFVQRVYLPGRIPYRIAIESRTENLSDENGLEWQIRDSAGVPITSISVNRSEDWKRFTAVVAPAAGDRVMRFVLAFHRAPGTVRPEGTARFRLAALEKVQ